MRAMSCWHDLWACVVHQLLQLLCLPGYEIEMIPRPCLIESRP